MSNVQFMEFSNIRTLWSRGMMGTHEGSVHTLPLGIMPLISGLHFIPLNTYILAQSLLSKNGLSQLRVSRRAQE